ncbi:MAG: SMP-30/gluconolactonase/LRE family protein [bacterium]|nr:SMP-30/gluconolactonase/LRE family protein [bacterium]
MRKNLIRLTRSKALWIPLAIALGITGWLGLTPAPIDPVVFEAPPPAGSESPGASDETLKRLEILDLEGRVGPEDVAVNSRGEVFAATESGEIVRMPGNGESVESYLNTGGRPLGIVFDRDENLIVADPYRGLLRVDRVTREIETLVPARDSRSEAETQNISLCYANNVDVGPQGVLYFTDSTMRFCPPAHGGTFGASLLDIFEHRKTGRFLAYDPQTRETRVLAGGLQFANGVAVSPDGKYALVVETGDCRIWRYHITGPRRGEFEVLIEGLSGYPDNLTRGLDGRYWIGFTKPRSKILEGLSERPFLRSLIARLPRSLLPVPPPFGHIMAIDSDGRVIEVFQDPDPVYPDATGATETAAGLYVHSLHAKGLGWLPRSHYQNSEQLQP